MNISKLLFNSFSLESAKVTQTNHFVFFFCFCFLRKLVEKRVMMFLKFSVVNIFSCRTAYVRYVISYAYIFNNLVFLWLCLKCILKSANEINNTANLKSFKTVPLYHFQHHGRNALKQTNACMSLFAGSA